jgi:hypothetical protein
VSYEGEDIYVPVAIVNFFYYQFSILKRQLSKLSTETFTFTFSSLYAVRYLCIFLRLLEYSFKNIIVIPILPTLHMLNYFWLKL